MRSLFSCAAGGDGDSGAVPGPGDDYQSRMLAEVNALDKAVTEKVSTEHL